MSDTFDSPQGATRSWPEVRGDGAPVTCLRCGNAPTDTCAGDFLALWCQPCFRSLDASDTEYAADEAAWHAHRATLPASPPIPDLRDELLEEATRLVVMLEAIVRLTPMNALYKNTFAESSVATLLADYRALRGTR